MLRMDVLGLQGQVCLDQKSGFIAHHTSQGESSFWNLYFWCKVVFLKYATTERQGLSFCEELSPAVWGSCFPGLPAGQAAQALQCSSAIP